MIESYSVREGDGRVALRAALGIVSPKAKVAWVHVANAGKYEGHHSGPFEMTADTFAQVVRNFEAQKNPIPFTYEHPAYDGGGDAVPAAGWVHQFATQGNGKELWAKVEFTERARKYIEAGEYRFCSIVLGLESTDRKTGEPIGAEVYEIGLTNNPFIDGLTPIKLSRRAPGKVREMSDAEIMAAALKALGEKATIQQMAEWAEHEKAKLAVEEGKPESDAPAEEMSSAAPSPEGVAVAASDAPPAEVDAADDPPMPEAQSPESNASEKVIQAIADQAGLDLAGALAALEENSEAIAAMLGGKADGGMAEQAAFAASRVRALEAELSQVKASLDAAMGREAEAKVDHAISAGRFLPAERENLVRLARKAPEEIDAFLAAASVVVPSPRRYQARSLAHVPEGVSEDSLDEVGRMHLAGLRSQIAAGHITRQKAVEISHSKQVQLARKAARV